MKRGGCAGGVSGGGRGAKAGAGVRADYAVEKFKVRGLYTTARVGGAERREKASKPLESMRVRIRITMQLPAVSSQLIRERAFNYTTL